ncbi:tRNA 4-thiouridine(8) synthase ThiI [Desulfarculales bacterium]
MPRALGLLSGGLDSILACLALRRAGVEVSAISFASPFFNADKAHAAAAAYGIPLTVLEVGPAHLEQVVKNPRYGYGSNMNPCIDCHAYMFRQAGAIMEREGFAFLFSGEVLGQRPMSQNKQALATVAKHSGQGPRILRPLSALVLAPTAMEESGLVDRSLLLGLSGRSRKPQMALAVELGVRDYPAPAGGCLLTEPGFSRRLKDLLGHDPAAGVELVELLKHGRHLRLSSTAKLIVGRNQAENQILEGLATASAQRLVAMGVPGPLGLYFGPTEGADLELAAALVAGYGQAPPGQEVTVQVGQGLRLNVQPLSRRLPQGYIL